LATSSHRGRAKGRFEIPAPGRIVLLAGFSALIRFFPKEEAGSKEDAVR
jgi:hypothetical protein